MQRDSWVFQAWTGPATLDQLGGGLERLWVDHPHVPAEVRVQMGIAVGEIGANIIEHAGRGWPVRMQVRVWVGTDRVKVRFTDDGRATQVDLRAVAQPDELAERGRGLAMAIAVLERLCYRRRRVVNRWYLVSKSFG